MDLVEHVKSLSLTLGLAKQELQIVELELANMPRLMVARSNLSASIIAIENMLERMQALDQDSSTGRESTDAKLEPPPPDLPVASSGEALPPSGQTDQPIWMGAQQVLATVGRPMTAPEIATMLQALNWPISGDTPAETVRTALGRKPHLFLRVDRGRFLLREWRVDLLPTGYRMRQQGQIDAMTQIILAEKSGVWATCMLLRHKSPVDFLEWPGETEALEYFATKMGWPEAYREKWLADQFAKKRGEQRVE